MLNLICIMEDKREKLLEVKSYIIEKYKKVFQNNLPRLLHDNELEAFLEKENWKEVVDYRITYMKENDWKVFVISDDFENVKNSPLPKLTIIV